MKIVAGRFVGFGAELLEDRGPTVLVELSVFGRRLEQVLPRSDTDLEPQPPPPVPPIDEVLDALIAWMDRDAPAFVDAMPPATDTELAPLLAFGEALGELGALYRRLGGTSSWVGFWRGLDLVSPDVARGSTEGMRSLVEDDVFYTWMPNEWWHPAWVPFLDNHSYDSVCIDLEGTFDGVPGQVITWHKDGAGREILAPSLAAWLHVWVEAGRRGLLAWQPDAGGLQVAPDADEAFRLLHRWLLPGYPRMATARTKREALGAPPPPKPPRQVEVVRAGLGYGVVRQQWAPACGSVHALAWLEGRGQLAVGQYDFAESPGLSLVDPTSGRVTEVLVDRGQGSVLELAAVPGGLVYRKLHGFLNRVHRWTGEDRPLREDLPTRMEAFVGVGGGHVAIAADPIEVWLQGDRAPRVTPIAGGGAVVALSADGRLLAVGRRDEPVVWYDVVTGKQVGRSKEVIDPKRLAFGLAGDLWVAGARSVRLDLATGETWPHDAAPSPFVVAVHPAGWVALAGYGGRVDLLDAHSGERVAWDSAHDGCRIYGLAFDAAGERLWSGCDGGKLVERRITSPQSPTGRTSRSDSGAGTG